MLVRYMSPRDRCSSVSARSRLIRGAPGASTKTSVAFGSSGPPRGSGGQRAAGSARGGALSGVGTTHPVEAGAAAFLAEDGAALERASAVAVVGAGPPTDSVGVWDTAAGGGGRNGPGSSIRPQAAP